MLRKLWLKQSHYMITLVLSQWKCEQLPENITARFQGWMGKVCALKGQRTGSQFGYVGILASTDTVTTPASQLTEPWYFRILLL